jgi:D-mannonate dehydratase
MMNTEEELKKQTQARIDTVKAELSRLEADPSKEASEEKERLRKKLSELKKITE